MSLVLHLIFAVVFGIMLWTTLSHRMTRSKQGEAPREGWLAEIVWMVLPIGIFYALVWPALQLTGTR